jgi:hypothetical protein
MLEVYPWEFRFVVPEGFLKLDTVVGFGVVAREVTFVAG